MRKLLMFFGVLAFVTQAHCKQSHENHEFLTVDNVSNHPVRLDFHDGKDNQYPTSILKPGDRTVLDLSILGQGWRIGKDQKLSHITITLHDSGKENNPEDVFKKRVSIKTKAFPVPVRITNAVTDFLNN